MTLDLPPLRGQSKYMARLEIIKEINNACFLLLPTHLPGSAIFKIMKVGQYFRCKMSQVNISGSTPATNPKHLLAEHENSL